MAGLDQALYQFHRHDEEERAQSLAKLYRLPYVNLVGYPIVPRTLGLVSPKTMLDYYVAPFLRTGDKLRVAMSEPLAPTVEFIQRLANDLKVEVDVAMASEASIRYAVHLAQIENQKRREELVIRVDSRGQKTALTAIENRQMLEETLARATATETLDIIFAGATGMEASDIHFEPQESNVRVRFRIDGVLQEIALLASPAYRHILSRVKYLASMKLDIVAQTQDGRFTISVSGSDLDVRVSTLPSTYGEVIDMRLLRAHAKFITLSELGLSSDGLAAITEAVHLPHGMVLITGPTGSGKTTTLYAVLQDLNQPGVKIITLEDPVEYRLEGIDQVAVSHEKGGLSFAAGLKGALRQDPDILLVGEIRDQETAEIGLAAAMTGHLFLSTLHTNNAPASLARLLDMGIEPYKIAGAINLIVAQRLVRKICRQCAGAGCDICYKTGYRGRLPILEYLKPSQALDAAIMRRVSMSELSAIAREGGMRPMREDGLAKVAAGLTTQEEVDRVTAEVVET